ncbi:MAG: DNA gyrase subunit A [Tissierellia bacterium]|nr:DNA gyrase subunit A [Bacillota bacterium]NLL22775.1 DNA gyrase subunit A [Tissierellia bacterium]
MEDTNRRIIEKDITEKMEQSYIDYSMSVIVSRALPDVRDGLKPVHRRILYSMWEQRFTHDKPHRKSARIVGDVIGKYHPHGDSAIYTSMVRLAQDFSTRYLLVDGQGNFGSIDGDGAAAMRYTEARLTGIADELLRDLDKETVDFMPNFDETLQQPTVLPSRFPNLLVNGSTGIAVGMTTSIPPHNLTEVINASTYLMDHPEASVDQLLSIVKGPDFPTGATIMGTAAMREAYRTGQGRIRVRAKAEIEERKDGRMRIVVTEIPYMLSKVRLLEDIANLVKNKRIDGITELRDESNRFGIRIVLELRRDVNANVILNQLYKHSSMQQTFSMIFIALDKGVPKTMNLKELLEKYIEHQKEVETRRIQYDLRKARERAHILEGLIKALQNIDEVIRIIRESYDNAKERLIEAFGFSEIQANNILSMQLRRLQGLEYEKISDELKALQEEIEYHLKVLADESLLMGIIKDSLEKIRDKFGDERRTQIEPHEDDIDIEDLIEEEQVVLTLTHKGYVKRVPQDTYQSQHRGGRGITALSMREEDMVQDLFSTSSHANLLFFTNFGKLLRMKAYRIPESSRTARGTPIVNLLQLEEGERVSTVRAVEEMDERKILLATKFGRINKFRLSDLESNRTAGIKVIRLEEGDEVIGVRILPEEQPILIATKKGMSITFDSASLRTQGRNTQGVGAIMLDEGDEVVSLVMPEPEEEIFTITEKGYGKRTDFSHYRLQNRYGKGLVNYRLTSKTGDVVACMGVTEEEELLVLSSHGQVIRVRASDISSIGRNTSGVRIMRMDEDASVISVAKADELEEEEDIDGTEDSTSLLGEE